MNRLIIIIVTFFSLTIFNTTAYAASPAKEIKEGNRSYKQGDYDKALENYEAAGEASPDSDIVHFNIGAAYYKKEQYQDAIDSFTKALNTEDKKTESDAIYNIANARYKLGSAMTENDINSAVSQYRESLEYFKRAIELDEGNRDAKYNHELVERELKVLLDKLKNQEQEDQEKKQDNENKEEEKSESKESESNGSKGDEKPQEQEARNDQDMNDDKGDQGRSGGEDPGQEQEAGRKEEKSDGMSPEEAKMLLEAFGEEEARDAVKKQKGAHYREVLKDW